MSSSTLPAHKTKHISSLNYHFGSHSFSLIQSNDGISNGTALWLGAQCLSAYLVHTLKTSNPSPKAIELGSGIGLTACVLLDDSLKLVFIRCATSLALESVGWSVLATDTQHVLSSVLANNIRSNSTGAVQTRHLDWLVPPHQWSWLDPLSITELRQTIPPHNIDLLKPPFDLICSADTVYIPELVEPLLRTFHALASMSADASPVGRVPPIILCVERRDSGVLDSFLTDAVNKWNFNVERVPRKKLAKAMSKRGVKWQADEWDGVEIWKLLLVR